MLPRLVVAIAAGVLALKIGEDSSMISLLLWPRGDDSLLRPPTMDKRMCVLDGESAAGMLVRPMKHTRTHTSYRGPVRRECPSPWFTSSFTYTGPWCRWPPASKPPPRSSSHAFCGWTSCPSHTAPVYLGFRWCCRRTHHPPLPRRTPISGQKRMPLRRRARRSPASVIALDPRCAINSRLWRSNWLSSPAVAAAMTAFVRLQGAVVLRGFGQLNGHFFEELLRDRLHLKPAPYTGSIGRRERVTAADSRTYVTRYPSHMVLMPHIEFGNMARRPEFVAFFCQAPAVRHGETPYVDFGGVWQGMSPLLRAKFARGIRFSTRMYPHFPYQFVWGDLASSWQGSLGTSDPAVAIERCLRIAGVSQCSWGWDGGLEYVSEFPAVHTDLQGNSVLSTTFGFWNSELPLLALLRVATRLTVTERVSAFFLMRCKFWGTICDPTPTRATWLDGSSLSVAESREVSSLIWSHSVVFPPQEMDVALLNNRRIGHGRMNVGGRPGQRKLVSYISGAFDVGPHTHSTTTTTTATTSSSGSPRLTSQTMAADGL
jgi:hypothetical protein